MNQTFTQFASAEAGKTDLFGSLGIDWTLLAIQTIAFLLLMWFLAKFVFPPLSRSLEKREADIESASKAAAESEKNAQKAAEEVKKALAQARKEAADIVTTAKAEANSIVSSAEEKSKVQAEHIVAEAHESIAKEVLAAKKALHNETIELVAQATEKVVGKTVDAKLDQKVIKSAVEEGK